jgi:hypothetical protein
MATPDHTPQGRGYDTSFVRCWLWFAAEWLLHHSILNSITSLKNTLTFSRRLFIQGYFVS